MCYVCLTVTSGMEILHEPWEFRKEVAIAPTTNCASEKKNGSFDRYITEKPIAATLILESTLLFETNKTFSWLNGLDISAKNLNLDMVCKSVRSVIKDYQMHQRILMKE